MNGQDLTWYCKDCYFNVKMEEYTFKKHSSLVLEKQHKCMLLSSNSHYLIFIILGLALLSIGIYQFT